MNEPKTFDETVDLFLNTFHQIPRAVLGGLMKEYLHENADSGWDGFVDDSAKEGIREFLMDLMRYAEVDSDSPEGLNRFRDQITNVNPVP